MWFLLEMIHSSLLVYDVAICAAILVPVFLVFKSLIPVFCLFTCCLSIKVAKITNIVILPLSKGSKIATGCFCIFRSPRFVDGTSSVQLL